MPTALEPAIERKRHHVPMADRHTVGSAGRVEGYLTHASCSHAR